MPDRRTPFLAGEEPETLLAFLGYLRDCVVAKTEGLSEADARRPMVPSGTSVLGVVKHLTMADVFWFQHTLAGLDVPIPEEALTDDDTVESVVAAYLDAGRRNDDVVRGLPNLDVPCARVDQRGPLNARWVLVHMVEETGRHAGHIDIVRELIDGAVGR